jgi:uncharacterized protein (DUF3084 family)
MFVLSMLIAFTMICSCQKQDSAAEAQLAQRKTELDAREEALIQREKAVDEREKAVAEREKAVPTSPIIQSRRQAPDAAQAEADRQKRIEQLPPELKALVPDRSRIEAEQAQRATKKQAQSAQRQFELQQSQGLQNARQRKFDAMKKWQMPNAAVSPGTQTSSPTPPPGSETEPPNPQ